MAHVRTDIRAAIKSALDAAAPVGWTVSADRGRPVTAEGLPSATIGVATEVAERRDRAGQPDKRTMRVEITILVAGDVVDDVLDAGCAWVEQAIAAAPTLGGAAEDCLYRETRIDIVAGGEKPAGQAVLAYDIRAAKALSAF